MIKQIGPVKSVVFSILFGIVFFYSCTDEERIDIEENSGALTEKSIDEVLFIGAWTEPIPGNEEDYQGFVLGHNKEALSINSTTILYKKWKYNNGEITFRLKSIDNQVSEELEETYTVKSVDKKTLILEKNGNKFLYTRNEAAKYPIVNVQEGQKITSPFDLEIDSKGVWFAHEGELGVVTLSDDLGSELTWELMTVAERDYMHAGSVKFKARLVFDTRGAKNGTLSFGNNSGAGGEETGVSCSFEILVTF